MTGNLTLDLEPASYFYDLRNRLTQATKGNVTTNISYNTKDYYYLCNGHGDVVQMVDTAGNIVNNYSYDEWGNILNKAKTVDPFKYAGEIFDDETVLYYLRVSYYISEIGRFISRET